MRSSIPCFIFVLATACTLGAQSGTRAWSAPVTPCTTPAPTGSLRPAALSPAVFLPDAQNGFAIEIESAPRVASWAYETTWAGFTGGGYYRWTGGNLFSTTGQGILTYRLMVQQAGRYQIVLHNRHNHSDSSQENDCWIRANGSGWTKLYSNVNNNSGVWNFHSRFDPGHGLVTYDLQVGLNTIELSARSANFMIDRIHVFPQGTGGYESTSVPISSRANSRPILGTRYTLEMGDPRDTAGLTAGGTVAYWLLATQRTGSSCGTAVPGFGPGTAAGELMIDLSSPPVIVGPVLWGGPTTPARFWFDVPNDPRLIGLLVETQGLLVDATPLDFVLTNRLDMQIGDV